MPSTEGDGSVEFSPGLFQRPTSLFFWGDDRILASQLVYHAARLADPEFVWIDIRSPHDPRSPGDPVLAHAIPGDRLVEIAPEKLQPRLGREESIFAKVMVLDTGGRLLRELTPFIQLPRIISSLVSRMTPVGRPRVLAVVNSERLARYYPPHRGLVRRFVRTLQHVDITLIVGYSGPERRDLNAWDHRFRLESSAAETGAVPTVRCERGAPGPEWTIGRAYPIDRLEGFSATVQELEDSGTKSPSLAFIPAVSAAGPNASGSP